MKKMTGILKIKTASREQNKPTTTKKKKNEDGAAESCGRIGGESGVRGWEEVEVEVEVQ